MKNHTTFRVGGPADIFLTPSAEELPAVLSICREEQMPVTVIGNGSNLLVGDQGIRGVVICIGFGMRGIRVDGEKIFLEAGVTLAAAAQQAAKAGLTGLEFASGIPGTFGGAVVMNAGAYGGEMKDVIVSVRVISEDGEILTLSKEELDSLLPPQRDTGARLSGHRRRTFAYTRKRSGSDHRAHGRTEKEADRKTAVGISERRQYL